MATINGQAAVRGCSGDLTTDFRFKLSLPSWRSVRWSPGTDGAAICWSQNVRANLGGNGKVETGQIS
jgi:hypothetical protein